MTTETTAKTVTLEMLYGAPRWHEVRWRGLMDAAHPAWQCAFRPFFVLTVLAAIALMLLWVAFLTLGLPLPLGAASGPFAWHAHELLLGMGGAAAAGFAMTAAAEFTETPEYTAQPQQRLVVLWLAARLAFWCSGFALPLLLLSGMLQLAFLGYLAALLWPRFWGDAGRRHMSFIWSLALLMLGCAGFYVQAARGAYAVPWLHGLLAAFLVLIVVALSRISMSMVNAALEDIDARDDEGEPLHYLARPPRRNLAMLCIGLWGAAQALEWPGSVGGWLALAASAAVFNLMGDWHVGRALLRRWALLLYGCYALMAAGFALIGLAKLGWLAAPQTAGVHLLTAGSFSLIIFTVMVIAGYTHSGLKRDRRPWVLWAAGGIVTAAVLRVLAYWVAPLLLQGISGLLWAASFAAMAWHMLPVWLAGRVDGRWGGHGVLDEFTDDALRLAAQAAQGKGAGAS